MDADKVDLEARSVISPQERQLERDKTADALMQRIWDGIHDKRYRQRMMRPVAVYLGTHDYDALRSWSKALQYFRVTPEGDEVMGLKVHQVTKNNHFNVTWEPE